MNRKIKKGFTLVELYGTRSCWFVSKYSDSYGSIRESAQKQPARPNCLNT